jgi:UPF0755 protein
LKKLLLLGFLGVGLVCALTLLQIQRWWTSPGPNQQAVHLIINAGDSLQSVASSLADRNALQYPRLWTWMARIKGLDNRIQQGEYMLEAQLSPEKKLGVLVDGRVVQYAVTLPEGITLAQAIDILQAEPALKHTLSGSADPTLLELALPHSSAEGLFFPDTYHFVRNDSDFSVLLQAHMRMQQLVAETWAEGGEWGPYKTPYELLIMASIVEKETGLAEERERIAGVFVRRLQQGMRLQTDPTVIYGLGSNFDGNLRRRHLDDASNLYNTYRHHGLPPGPIALPGRDALRAAIYPAAGNELYFVARGDGSHVFSDTLEQHRQAVKEFQMKRVENYRSTPKQASKSDE